MASLNEQWQEIKDRYAPIVMKLVGIVKAMYLLIAPYVDSIWEHVSKSPIWKELAHIIKKSYKFIRTHYERLEEKLSPSQKKILRMVLSGIFKISLVAMVSFGYLFFINIPTIVIKRQQQEFYQTLSKASFVIAQAQSGKVELPQTKEEFEMFIKSELELVGMKATLVMPEEPNDISIRMSFDTKDIVNIFDFLVIMSRKGIQINDIRVDNISKNYSAVLGI